MQSVLQPTEKHGTKTIEKILLDRYGRSRFFLVATGGSNAAEIHGGYAQGRFGSRHGSRYSFCCLFIYGLPLLAELAMVLQKICNGRSGFGVALRAFLVSQASRQLSAIIKMAAI